MTAHPLEALSALLDDELPPTERAAVEAHLAACASCARHLRELGAVDDLARGLPPAGAPDGYLEALPGRVRRRIRADRPALLRASWVLPLAAGLALAVVTPIVLQQRRESVPLEDRPAAAMEQPPPAATATQEPPAVVEEPLASAAEGAPAPRPQARSGARRREAAPAAPPPAASAPEGAAKVDAFAPPPADAAAEQDRAAQRANAATAETVVAEAELKAARDEGRADAPRAAAAGGVGAASSLKKEKDDAGRKRAAEEQAFHEASSLPAAGPDQARRVREAWRRFVSLHPAGPRADEGRVRWIESAVAVFRLTGDPDDRAIAEREGRAYLSSPNAPQAARVTAALRRLDAAR